VPETRKKSVLDIRKPLKVKGEKGIGTVWGGKISEGDAESVGHGRLPRRELAHQEEAKRTPERGCKGTRG